MTTVVIDPASRFRGDSGAILTELALVMPLLVLLSLGIFEYGFILRNSNVLANSVQSAGRTAAQSKNTSTADLFTLQNFMATTAKLKNATVTKVIIYNSTVSGGAPPAACLTASITGSSPHGVNAGGVNCSVYSAADLTPANLATGNFNCTALGVGTPGWDKNWCPLIRDAGLTSQPDYVGVYAVITYTGITGLLPGKTMTLTDRAVNRIEPNI